MPAYTLFALALSACRVRWYRNRAGCVGEMADNRCVIWPSSPPGAGWPDTPTGTVMGPGGWARWGSLVQGQVRSPLLRLMRIHNSLAVGLRAVIETRNVQSDVA